MLSRMERNKALHRKIQVENAKYVNAITQDEEIRTLLEKLDRIDTNFFRLRVGQFAKRQQFDRPYLDQETNDITISDKVIYELRGYVAELKKIDPNTLTVPTLEEELDEKDMLNNLHNQHHVQFATALREIEAWLEARLQYYNEVSVNEKQSNVNMKISDVKQLRNHDQRSIHEMLKNVNEKLAKIDHQAALAKSQFRKDKSMRFVNVLLPILIVILFGTALAVILLLVL